MGIVLNAQLLNDAAALCSTENKRVFIQTKLIYTPAAQRISEWGNRTRELASLSAGAGEHVRRVKLQGARERTGRNRASAQEREPEQSVMMGVIRSGWKGKEGD